MKRRIEQTLAFVTISALCGLLVAGLLLPLTIAVASTTNSAASASVKIPARMPPATSPAGRSELLFADGSHLAWFFDRNRVLVPLTGIAPVMRQAQLAIENHRFYHRGRWTCRGWVEPTRETSRLMAPPGSDLESRNST